MIILKLSKNRLEALSDGIIAIITTIMVLDIPMPDTFEPQEIFKLLLSIFVFFVSFFVVGSYWHRHYFIFNDLKEVNNKIIWRNFLFLFSLSLMPIFAKWVIKDFGQIIPAVGYVCVFLVVNFAYRFLYSSILLSDEETKIRIKEKIKGKTLWIHVPLLVIIGLIIVALALGFAILFPSVSTVILIGLPLGFSIFNLWFDKMPNRRDIN